MFLICLCVQCLDVIPKREKSVFEYVSKKEILHCAKNLICAEVFDPESLIKKIIVCKNKFVVHKHKVFGLCFPIFVPSN